MTAERWEPTDEQRALAYDRARRQADNRKPHERAASVVNGRLYPRVSAEWRPRDPTDILDDEPDPRPPQTDMDSWFRPSFHMAPAELVTFRFDASAMQAAFERAAEVLAHVHVRFDLGDTLTLTLPASGTMKQEADLEPDDVVNRRRHGNAATCPRHGETKGGLCRKCRR